MKEHSLTQKTKSRKTLSDSAVDGLFAGLIAGVVMAVSLLIIGLLAGENLAQVFGRFSARDMVNPLAGALSHLSTSAIYGLIFGLIAPRLGIRDRIPPWALGLVYGLLLYALGWFVLLPQSASPLQEIGGIQFAIAHLVYGTTLGLYLSQGNR